MNDKLDKLFANVHNNEKAIGLIFFLLLINGNDQRFDQLEDINEEYIYIYVCVCMNVHMDGIDHLDCIILSLFIFFFNYIWIDMNNSIYSDKQKKKLWLFSI
jgi:hypothetical protein